MKGLKLFWTLTTWCFAILILLIVAGIFMTLDGCTSANPDTVGKWVYWTSPDPRIGVLDRVVIIRHSVPITESNFNQTTVMTIHNYPAAIGAKDSTYITYESGDGFYIAAVSFNTIAPDERSVVSNTIYVGGPAAIIDLRF